MQLLPIHDLRSMTVVEQDKLALEAAKFEKRVNTVHSEQRSAFPAVGKLVCVIEERLNELKGQKKIGSNVSLAKYWEGITNPNKREKAVVRLNPHAYSCAVAFGCFVRTELITEADYDKNTSQCLELAASIANEINGDVTHEAMEKAAEELRDRSKDAAKNLRAILETVKGAKAMTAEKAQELVTAICAAGHMNTVLIPTLNAEIANLTDSESARDAFFNVQLTVAAFEMNKDEKGKRRFPDEVIDGWIRGREAANAPVQVLAAGETKANAKKGGKGDGKTPANVISVVTEPTAVAA